MRFTLIDRILELHPGERITAVKSLSLAEEYLEDHFPLFPVMPGVLMLEALTQASAWLVRASEDFCHSIVVLQQAKNVKYGYFVQPGEVLDIHAEIVKQDDRLTTFKAKGTVAGQTAVSARLVIERFNVLQQYPDRAAVDARVRRKMRELFALLYPASA